MMLFSSVTGAIVMLACAGLALRWAERVAVRDRAAELGGALRAAAPPGFVSRALSHANVAIQPSTALQCWGLAVVCSFAVLAPFDARLAGTLAVAVAVGAPAWIWLRRARSDELAAQAIPEMLTTIASELRAGGTVTSGLKSVAESSSALAAAADQLILRLAMGADFETATVMWTSNTPGDDLRAAAGGLMIAHSLGGPAANSLDGLAYSLRQRFDVLAEVRAQAAQAKASALVMVCAPVGYLLVSTAIDQRSVDVLLGSSFGRACGVVGLILETLGYCWVRSMLRDRWSL